VIEREKLADNARDTGNFLKQGLDQLAREFPAVVRGGRGLGLMLGLELIPDIPSLKVEGKLQSAVFVARLQEAGVLMIPAGANVLRLLPALNLTLSEAQEGLQIIESVIAKLAA
jgi:4-aminobutyrate aminotransferase-like enzyme